MARPAEQSIVLESTLPAAVGYRDDVVCFPPGTCRTPPLTRRAIDGRRFRTSPLAVRFDDVEAAELTGAFVAFFDLLPHVPGTAADLPFVHARIAAECAARTNDRTAAPSADGVAGFIAFGDTPLVGRDGARATSTHARSIGTMPAGLQPG